MPGSANQYRITPLFIAVILLETVSFLLDLYIPRGYSKWVMYFFPLLLIWNTTPFQIYSAVSLTTIYVFIGLLFSPSGGTPMQVSILNRVSAAVIFWVVSYIFVSRIKSQAAQRATSRRLRESTAMLEAFFASAPTPLDILDEEFRYVKTTGATAAYFGLTAQQMLGRSFAELAPGLFRESLGEILRQVLEKGTVFTSVEFQGEDPRPGRGKIYLRGSYFPVSLPEGRRGVGAITIDITDTKSAERELKRLLEENRSQRDFLDQLINSANVAIGVMKGEELRFTFVNPAYQAIRLDFPMIGQRYREVFPQAAAAGDEQKLLQVLATGVPWQIARHLAAVPGRPDAAWEGQISRLTASGQEGEPSILAVIWDVTAQFKAEEKLREGEARLKMLNENLENLVVQRTQQVRALSKALTFAEQRERKRFSIILHESLQQKLLGARLLFNQHLRDHQNATPPSESEELQAGIGVLNKAVQIAKNLSLELNPPILQTEGLDAALRWLCDHMRKSHGLSVELRMRGALGQVRGDSQILMVQMVRELLDNVVKHAGILQASIEAVRHPTEIEIVVLDKGRGFSTERLPGSVPEESRFGLFSVRERLSLLGGQLKIDSRSGEGTRVTIVFPFANL